MKKTVPFLLLYFYSTLTLAISPWELQRQKDLALFSQVAKLNVPQAFVREKTWDWKKSWRPREIIYGNPKIGFFSSRNFNVSEQTLKLQLIPPTFKDPIEFKTVNDQGKVFLLDKVQYKNPFGELLDNLAFTSEPASFPFIMVNGTDRLIPMVLNKFGEVVWLFDNHKPNPVLETVENSAIDILPNGDFLFLGTREATRLTWISSFGKIKYDINFEKEKIPYPNTHTVQYLAKTNEILFLAQYCKELSRWDEFIPLFRGLSGWWRLWTLPRRTYMGSKLVRMSLDTRKVTEVWNSFKLYSPAKNPSLAVGFFNNADRFMDAKDEEQYRIFLNRKNFFSWANWPNEHCHVDWTHENSAYYIEGKGYLVSVRNLNEVIFLDERGNLVWNMGEGPGYTYSFPRDDGSFSMQHSAVPVGDHKILIYDNHSPYRGETDYRLFNRVIEVDTSVPGTIRPTWAFVLPTPHSHIRGTVQPLPHGRVFSYTAGDPGVPMEFFEIDPASKKIVGYLRYPFAMGSKGFEAKPFWSFGGDKYLGADPSPHVQQKLESQEKEGDVLQFSY